jgi:hypothetical protein
MLFCSTCFKRHCCRLPEAIKADASLQENNNAALRHVPENKERALTDSSNIMTFKTGNNLLRPVNLRLLGTCDIFCQIATRISSVLLVWLASTILLPSSLLNAVLPNNAISVLFTSFAIDILLLILRVLMAIFSWVLI